MTSRTGHVMATATLQPLDERLRDAQTAAVAAADRSDVVNGQSPATSSTSASTVSSISEVVVN